MSFSIQNWFNNHYSQPNGNNGNGNGGGTTTTPAPAPATPAPAPAPTQTTPTPAPDPTPVATTSPPPAADPTPPATVTPDPAPVATTAPAATPAPARTPTVAPDNDPAPAPANPVVPHHAAAAAVPETPTVSLLQLINKANTDVATQSLTNAVTHARHAQAGEIDDAVVQSIAEPAADSAVSIGDLAVARSRAEVVAQAAYSVVARVGDMQANVLTLLKA